MMAHNDDVNDLDPKAGDRSWLWPAAAVVLIFASYLLTEAAGVI